MRRWWAVFALGFLHFPIKFYLSNFEFATFQLLRIEIWKTQGYYALLLSAVYHTLVWKTASFRPADCTTIENCNFSNCINATKRVVNRVSTMEFYFINDKSAILCPTKTEVADFVSFKGSIVQGINLCNKYQYNNVHKFDYL